MWNKGLLLSVLAIRVKFMTFAVRVSAARDLFPGTLDQILESFSWGTIADLTQDKA
jgi:hypothetical protein